MVETHHQAKICRFNSSFVRWLAFPFFVTTTWKKQFDISSSTHFLSCNCNIQTLALAALPFASFDALFTPSLLSLCLSLNPFLLNIWTLLEQKQRRGDVMWIKASDHSTDTFLHNPTPKLRSSRIQWCRDWKGENLSPASHLALTKSKASRLSVRALWCGSKRLIILLKLFSTSRHPSWYLQESKSKTQRRKRIKFIFMSPA